PPRRRREPRGFRLPSPRAPWLPAAASPSSNLPERRGLRCSRRRRRPERQPPARLVCSRSLSRGGARCEGKQAVDTRVAAVDAVAGPARGKERCIAAAGPIGGW
ncbi:Os02g0467400, partial [Oryza sativa Japonica Group]